MANSKKLLIIMSSILLIAIVIGAIFITGKPAQGVSRNTGVAVTPTTSTEAPSETATPSPTPIPVQRLKSNLYTKGAGPLYWCTYEYQFTNNSYMPEDRWKANIDWIADSFLQYGYDMACTDGWIEKSTKVNENGYILSHNDTWEHDWKYWSDYLNKKGMKLGVYYNPLWVSPSVIGHPEYKVVGTDYTVESLTNKDDRFNGGQPTSLYWVDVTKPGAEEYVKGYINYFKSCGVKFLRVDFLSWYEDGQDKGKRVGKPHGTENYDLALKWMAEACGDDIELSLVMPHLYNDGATELKYGDMIRINEDARDGTWQRFSDVDRGGHYKSWSQYHNAFDGLIYWSKISDQIILDADMLRIHRMATDEQKKSAVSLCVLAGAPVDMADQYDTIGNNAWVYQNAELLELNKQGFKAKPFSNDPKDPESSKWKGQLPDGSWVIGYFNRSNASVDMSVDLKATLGLSQDAAVRDIWAHKDLGKTSTFSYTLKPYDCLILKVTP
ncbi:MAG: hypothetical protein N2376_12965 [Clostridia bacterium]|nr:hypothetical protein [Clostridia bacterium]